MPAVAGLHSPATGIVNAHGLMERFAPRGATPRCAAAAARRGGRDRAARRGLPARAPHARRHRDARPASGSSTPRASRADQVAALAGIDVAAAGYRLHWWKGSYFAVSGAKATLLSRLVYPVPDHASLGVHAVLGLEGRLRFGPDAEHLADAAPRLRRRRVEARSFARAVQRLVPAITEDDLSPDIAGIRAKLQGPGEGFRDFVIARGERPRPARLREPDRHRLAGSHLRARDRRGGRPAARVMFRTAEPALCAASRLSAIRGAIQREEDPRVRLRAHDGRIARDGSVRVDDVSLRSEPPPHAERADGLPGRPPSPAVLTVDTRGGGWRD